MGGWDGWIDISLPLARGIGAETNVTPPPLAAVVQAGNRSIAYTGIDGDEISQARGGNPRVSLLVASAVIPAPPFCPPLSSHHLASHQTSYQNPRAYSYASLRPPVLPPFPSKQPWALLPGVRARPGV